MQEACHTKGRIVGHLPAPLCPVSWQGSFQTRLPVSAPTITAYLSPPSLSSNWQPYLEAATEPLVATMQYRIVVGTGVAAQLPPRALRNLERMFQAGTPALWPPAELATLEVMPPMPCLHVRTDEGQAKAGDRDDLGPM
jgi:hypothetical protein